MKSFALHEYCSYLSMRIMQCIQGDLGAPFLALPVILTKTIILLLFQKTLREKFNGVNVLKLLFLVTDAATNKLECLPQSIF
jgi:hypothetical protein